YERTASAFIVQLCAPHLDHTRITHDPVRNVRLCPGDPQHPIITTYQKVFPEHFRSFDLMPDGLKKHVRYPGSLQDPVRNLQHISYG
ncbi:MAG: hypothetical protein C5617_000175, partial [ANME-2 cluster archaeon]